MSTKSDAEVWPHLAARWWWIVIVLVAGGTGLALYEYLATEHDWRSAEAELDIFYGRRLAELEADRRSINEADNAALQIILAHSKSPKLRVSDANDYDEIFAKLKPTIQMNSQQVDLIRRQLKTAPAAITEARKLKDMPIGRFAVRFSIDYIATQFPSHEASLVSEWLLHDAYLLAQEDRCDEAIENCRAILNIGRAIGDDRFVLSHLIRIGHQTTATEVAERVFAQGTPEKKSLSELQLLVAREIIESKWTGPLRGELAGWHHLFEQIRNGTLERTYLRDLTRLRRSETMLERAEDHIASGMMKYAPNCLRALSRRIEISKLPLHEQRTKLRELEETTRRNPIYSGLVSDCSSVLEAELISQALLRATLVALACERYRVEYDRWPETLDTLVAEKLLPSLPIDPVDGKPLRYRRNAEGIVIYSIGLDEKDDKGTIVRPPLVLK